MKVIPTVRPVLTKGQLGVIITALKLLIVLGGKAVDSANYATNLLEKLNIYYQEMEDVDG